MNQAQHDELAQLFAHQMQVSGSDASRRQVSAPRAQTQPETSIPVQQVYTEAEKRAVQQEQVPVHFISSHYTGTAHVVADSTGTSTSEPSRSPPPSYHEALELMPAEMAETLRQHRINPSALMPNQVRLFENADHEQKLRLLELWQIGPMPCLGEVANSIFGAGQTTLDREEKLARIRYEEEQLRLARLVQQHQEHFKYKPEHVLDTATGGSYANAHLPPVSLELISPIREPGDTPWPPDARMRAASIIARTPDSAAEPYIVSGYSQDAPRTSTQAVEPVYAWQSPCYAQAMQDRQQQQQQLMENQYGMLEQIRNHADWERMNEQLARERLAQAMLIAHGGAMQDEDMVM